MRDADSVTESENVTDGEGVHESVIVPDVDPEDDGDMDLVGVIVVESLADADAVIDALHVPLGLVENVSV